MTSGPATGDSPPLIVIAGATATGKTGLSIGLAHALGAEGVAAEIISADSRQVFRGLDIGTAKVPAADRARIPHHGLDLVDPDEPFSIAAFVTHTRAALVGIAARGAVAMLVGGTGLYLRAITRGLDTDALPSDPVVRAAVEALLASEGLPAAVERLQAIAPNAAARIDLRNPRRVARALEVAEIAGDVPLPAPRGYLAPILWLGLSLAPAVHLEWIRARATAQFAAGLVDEARALRERWEPALPCFSAIGYREAWAVLDDVLDVPAAIELDVARNVAFARRQRTWFRREPGIEWLDPAVVDPLPRALDRADALLANRAPRAAER